jgi:hypothetical protein
LLRRRRHCTRMRLGDIIQRLQMRPAQIPPTTPSPHAISSKYATTSLTPQTTALHQLSPTTVRLQR